MPCVLRERCLHVRGPPPVQVNAQVMPHNECVERSRVSADGQRVQHITSCEIEVEKLQVRYVGSAQGTSIPFPLFSAFALDLIQLVSHRLHFSLKLFSALAFKL